ncbi:hypothetical protein FXN61_40955, partial [Lentzea sp. PSKA42]
METSCNFPGCERPVFRGGGPGRPSEYCDLPEHTRWRAWRERQRLAAEPEQNMEVVTVTNLPRVSGTAKIRAEELLDRFRVLSEQMTQTLGRAVGELNAMADPSVAESQIQAAEAEAARRVAEAQAELASAERRRHDAERAR